MEALGKGAAYIPKVGGAADKLLSAADFIKGAAPLTGNLGQKITQGALRGAAQGAEQAIPRAVFALDRNDPNSPQKAMEGILPSVGLGAAAGGLLGPLAQRLLGKSKLGQKAENAEEFGKTLPEYAIDEAKEALDKATIASVGIDTRNLRKAVQPLGLNRPQAGARRGDEYVQGLAQWVRDKGIRGKRQFEAAVEKNDKDWSTIDRAFDENVSSVKPDWNKELAGDLSRDSELMSKAIDEGDDKLLDVYDEFVNKVATTKSKDQLREMFRTIARNNSAPNATISERARARLALSFGQKLDEYIADSSGLGNDFVKGVKTDYKMLQPFMVQESRDAFKLGKVFDQGPGTAEKLISGALPGAVAGGALGAGAEAGNENADASSVLQALVAGSLLGGVAKKAIPKAANKIVDELGRIGGGVLGNEKVAGKIAELGEKVREKAGGVGTVVANLAATKRLQGEEGVESGEIEGAGELPGQGGVIPVSTESEGTGMSDEFKSVLSRRLNYIYNTEYSDMPPEEFIEKVRKRTKNFTDQEANASVLFDTEKDQKKYLRDFANYQKLKDLDIDKAISGGGGTALPLNLGVIGQDQEGAKARDLLVDALLDIQTEGDVSKRSDAQRKIIAQYIDSVRGNPELLQSLIQSYGLDFGDLKKLGVI
jgi:hypothetical protein